MNKANELSSTGITLAYLYNSKELGLPPEVIFSARDKEQPQMTTVNACNLRENLKDAFCVVGQILNVLLLLVMGGPLQILAAMLLSQHLVHNPEPAIHDILWGHDVMGIPE